MYIHNKNKRYSRYVTNLHYVPIQRIVKEMVFRSKLGTQSLDKEHQFLDSGQLGKV